MVGYLLLAVFQILSFKNFAVSFISGQGVDGMPAAWLADRFKLGSRTGTMLD